MCTFTFMCRNINKVNSRQLVISPNKSPTAYHCRGDSGIFQAFKCVEIGAISPKSAVKLHFSSRKFGQVINNYDIAPRKTKTKIYRTMAQGMKCPQSRCGYWMYAVSEKEEPKGSFVVYKCRACGFELRVFEPK